MLPNEVLMKLFKVGVKDTETLKALKLTSKRFHKLIMAANITCIQIKQLHFDLKIESQDIKVSYRKWSDMATEVIRYWSPERDIGLADLMQHMTVTGGKVFFKEDCGHPTTSVLFQELVTSPIKFYQIESIFFSSKLGSKFDLSYLNAHPGSVSQGDLLAFLDKVNPFDVRVSFF